MHHLVQSGLCEAVVLDDVARPQFLHVPEDGGQGGPLPAGGYLVGELSVMLLLQLHPAQALPHSHLHLLGVARQAPDGQAVPGPEPVLQVLDGAQTLELTIDHDAQPRAEGLALLHAVGGQHHRLPAPHHLQDGVPQEPPGPGVHPTGGLVQEHDGGIADQSYGGGQLPLVPP